LQAENAALQDSLDRSEEVIAQMEQDMTSQAAQIAELEAVLSEKDDELPRLSNNGSTLDRVAGSGTMLRVAEMENKVRQLAELVKAKDAQLAETAKVVEAKDSKIAQLARQAQSFASDRDRATSALQVLQDQLRGAQASLVALEQDTHQGNAQPSTSAPRDLPMETVRAGQEEMRGEVERLQLELAESKDLIRDLQRKTQRQQVASSEYKREANELRKILEEKERNISGFKKIIDQQEELVTEQNKVGRIPNGSEGDTQTQRPVCVLWADHGRPDQENGARKPAAGRE
jgi:chromosome segregation ATPase